MTRIMSAVLCPASTDYLLPSLQSPEGLFVSHLISSPFRVFLSAGISPHLPLPVRVLVPFLICLLCFYLFCSSQWQGDFSCPFGCLKSPAHVQQVLCENYSKCRYILDVLVRRDEFHILLFHHLDSSEILFLPLLFLFHQLLDSPKYATKLNGHPGGSLLVYEACDQIKITKQVCLHTDTQAQSKKKYYLY